MSLLDKINKMINALPKEKVETKQVVDPYTQAGGKNYWKMHVPASQRPKWVRDKYGID